MAIFLARFSYFYEVKKTPEILVNIEIDKLTNSIENIVSGDIFDTEVFQLFAKDSKQINKKDWQFKWDAQVKLTDRATYKLVIKDNPQIVQGLISLSDQHDHIYMHLIESAKFNKGKQKVYAGVPGNLVAFACQLSFEKGYEGYVAFDAKTVLIRHYQETLFATHFRGTKMMIETAAATRLINQYFKR
ncbi:MAG: hypothetical protein JWR61_3728 [Ferruginibacter sp.]|jgi:hypothetical protein|uniref:hypothetical protein n=1 Tax=Ferruginibacter sp. TaxID=1940288 RepID=UPI00265951F7|nr:hypothetical protein [Ferruginibacter sp.]MDB5278773.1 hypothetical protein [Ferruginibacter sp.]